MDIQYGEWKVIRRIGSGASGTVYEIAKTDIFGDTYRAALKVITVPADVATLDGIRNELDDDNEAVRKYFWDEVEKIVREFQMMYQLRGITNIVNYQNHEIVAHQDEIGWDIMIEMELLTSLTKYARENGLRRSDVIRLGIDICRALEYCGSENIIHRDIKPDNILVSDKGIFKLADFGIAREIERTMAGLSQRKGTYNYMAPEVYHSQEYGFSIDIYSLGIVMYRFLNDNKLPFQPYDHVMSHSEQQEILDRRMSGETIPLPRYETGRLAEIVLKACEYDHENRYRTPAQMREDLEALQKLDSEDFFVLVPKKKGANPANGNNSDGSNSSNVNGSGSEPDQSNQTAAQNEVEKVLLTDDKTVAKINAGIEASLLNLGDEKTEYLNLTAATSPTVLKEFTEIESCEEVSSEDHVSETEPLIAVSDENSIDPVSEEPFAKEESEEIQAHEECEVSENDLSVTETSESVEMRKNLSEDNENEKTVAVSAEKATVSVDSTWNEPEPRKKKKVWLPFVLAAVLCLALFGGYRAWEHNDYIKNTNVVPSVKGMTVAEAEEALRRSNMIPVEGKSVNSDSVPKGLVVSADYEGERLNLQTEVSYYVSLGDMIIVPNIVGKTDKEAQSELENCKLKVNALSEYSEEVEKGRIISQKPAADSSLNEGDLVEMVISRGKEPIKIDKYTGKKASEVEKDLKELGLIVKTVKKYSDTVTKGDIIKQKPKDGEKLFKGDTITLYVSKGIEQVIVPGLVGKSKDKAIAELKSVGLDVKNINTDYSSEYAEGIVMIQGYTAGEKVDKGTAVSIRVSLGPEPVAPKTTSSYRPTSRPPSKPPAETSATWRQKN